MIIEATYVNGTSTYISDVKNYDFYPETKTLFVECMNDESFYIPVSKNVKKRYDQGRRGTWISGGAR